MFPTTVEMVCAEINPKEGTISKPDGDPGVIGVKLVAGLGVGPGPKLYSYILNWNST
jgi:hypothetical protein